MISSRKISTRSAFTLIELLVAMAVLALILVMLLLVTSGILQSTRTQNRQMDSVAAARRALDAIESDLRRAVINSEASVLVRQGEQSIAMLTERRGPASANNHHFLAVRYSTNAEQELLRSYASVPFTATPGLLNQPVQLSGTNSVISRGILGFQIRVIAGTNKLPISSSATNNWATANYQNQPVAPGWLALVTTASPGGSTLTNRAQSLRIWLAATEEQTLQLLRDTGQLSTVQTLLASTENPAEWRTALDNAPDLPAIAKSSIRILQKNASLP